MHRGLAVLVLGVASLVFVSFLARTRFFRLVESKAYDLQFLARGSQPTSDIIILAIDQKSVDRLQAPDRLPEPLMFWHRYYAQAIRAAALAGARVFGLDIFFAIPVTKWEPQNDRELAEAVVETSAAMPVICGFVPGAVDKQMEWPVPLYLFASAAGLTASLHLEVDPDDFIRRQQLIEQGSGPIDGRTRSLALRIAEKFLGQQTRVANGHLYLGNISIPADREGSIAINYAGPPGTFPQVSLADFLDAARAGDTARLRGWVQGKIVLLGTDSITGQDHHATPFYTLGPGPTATTPGIEIHANIIHTILEHRFLVSPPAWASLSILFLIAAAGAAVAIYQKLRQATLSLAAMLAATLLAGHLLFRMGTVLPVASLVSALLFAFVAAVVYQSESRRAFLATAFSIFVGRGVAKGLEESGQIAVAAGARRHVTILFSDIRGFTAFCDQKEPTEVVQALNRYLTAMVEIIIRRHGEVNKFIGDGILAIFSNSDPGAAPGDHALRAVRCGLEMVQAPGEFRTGVGIHTGEALVGNVGSFDKLEHAVLGDTVNLASRLEGLNKELLTQMLLSEDTARLLGDALPLTDLGPATVRGRSRPVRVFTPAVLPGPSPAADPSRKAVLALLLLGLIWSLRAQPAPEPVGLVIAAGADAQIVRRGSTAPVRASIGEILFAGDRLAAGAGPASFLYCPARLIETIDPQSEALFEITDLKLQRGKVASKKPVATCLLPRAVDLSPASRQRVGGLTMRDVPPDLELLTPLGDVILDAPLKFGWRSREGADSYQIEVANAQRTPVWNTRLEGTQIEYPAWAPPLLSPATYYWKVTALAAGKPIAATQSTFQLPTTAERQQIRQQLASILKVLAEDPSNPALQLAKAAEFERAGRRARALDEYRTLAEAWKDASWLQEKVRELQSARLAAQLNVLAPQ